MTCLHERGQAKHSAGALPELIRLGAISFVNTLPLYQGLQSTELITLCYQPPATLNHMMLNDELDVSPVSSAFYLNHTDQLLRLDNISVSSYGSVDSVLFLSKVPLSQLLDECPTIAIPDDSATSVQLLRYLLNQQLGESIDHRLVTYSARDYQQALSQHGCGLIIGDRALMAKMAIDDATLAQQSCEMQAIHQECADWFIYDLSNGWVEQTGYPVVFAVWVAQRHFAEAYPEAVQQIQAELVANHQQFWNDSVKQQVALQTAKQSLPLPDDVLLNYWRHSLHYGWSPEHDASLTRWKEIMTSMSPSLSKNMSPAESVLS